MNSNLKELISREKFDLEKQHVGGDVTNNTEFNTWKSAQYSEFTSDRLEKLQEEVKELRKELSEIKELLTKK